MAHTLRHRLGHPVETTLELLGGKWKSDILTILKEHLLHDALLNAAKIWRGLEVKGMYDWFATGVRMRFSRPMPFQIGGDPMGERSEIVLRAARERVRVIDWRAALATTEVKQK